MINETLNRLERDVDSLENLYDQPVRDELAIVLTHSAINEYIQTLSVHRNEISADRLDQINSIIDRINSLVDKLTY